MENTPLIKKIGTIVVLALLCYPLSAQKNFQPGFIISLNNDTLIGQVDYRNWKRNPEEIIFRNNAGNDIHKYIPGEIKEFGVAGEIYESAIIKKEVSHYHSGEWETSNDFMLEPDTVFLLSIIRGSKNLYEYLDMSGNEKFYIKDGSSYDLLVYKKYLQEQGDSKIIAENKKYLGQLSVYLQDNPSVISVLNSTKYSRSSLKKLFLQYYSVTSKKANYQIRTEKTKLEYGILGGISSTFINFNTDVYGRDTDFDYLVTADYRPSTNFTAGLFFDFILPRNQQKWSVYNELFFSKFIAKSSIDDFIYENKYLVTKSEIGYSYLKLNNMGRFTYPFNNFAVFFNAGFSNGYAVAETNYKIRESRYDNEVIKDKVIEKARKYEQGLLFGTGGKYKKYSLEMRYEIGGRLSEYFHLDMSANRLYLLFGYRF